MTPQWREGWRSWAGWVWQPGLCFSQGKAGPWAQTRESRCQWTARKQHPVPGEELMPGDGSTAAVWEWEVAEPVQEPPLLAVTAQGTGAGQDPRLMRTWEQAALTLWDRQLSFQMEESKIGNEWKMNFFWGCQWTERLSADYMLYVYQRGNLVKCAGADVMVTNHMCCLNKIWISIVMFDNIWFSISFV